jgi:hypothetical protein
MKKYFDLVDLGNGEFYIRYLVDGVSQWESSVRAIEALGTMEIADLVSFLNQVLTKKD